MAITETELKGVFLIEPDIFSDDRGLFIKPYNEDLFRSQGIQMEIKESFYSVSMKNVIRGMHFQLPPFDYEKMVYVTDGRIKDVLLDLRKGSPSYTQFFSIELSAENARQIYMPKGIAHGFVSLSDKATVTYLQSVVHRPDYDAGIKWNSFGMEWNIDHPVLSERDQAFPVLGEFDSPFQFES